MNLVIFELFSCPLRGKQNEIKGLKRDESVNKVPETSRQTEPYEQWIFEEVGCSKC